MAPQVGLGAEIEGLGLEGATQLVDGLLTAFCLRRMSSLWPLVIVSLPLTSKGTCSCHTPQRVTPGLSQLVIPG